jgi:hypothetical protein
MEHSYHQLHCTIIAPTCGRPHQFLHNAFAYHPYRLLIPSGQMLEFQIARKPGQLRFDRQTRLQFFNPSKLAIYFERPMR